jgi:Domain of unknown function (DUF5665)
MITKSEQAPKKESLKDIINAVSQKETVLRSLPNREQEEKDQSEKKEVSSKKEAKTSAKEDKLIKLSGKKKFPEIVNLQDKKTRLLLINFMAGMARGFGFIFGSAVGLYLLLIILDRAPGSFSAGALITATGSFLRKILSIFNI